MKTHLICLETLQKSLVLCLHLTQDIGPFGGKLFIMNIKSLFSLHLKLIKHCVSTILETNFLKEFSPMTFWLPGKHAGQRTMSTKDIGILR